MNAGRRLFIKGALALTALIGMTRALFAAAWPQKAFASTVAREALINLLGTDQTTLSDEITLTLPAIAESGATVPLSVKTTLPGIESISIIVENNPRPLVISFEFYPDTLPELTCRIKMAETSEVMAVVVTNRGIFSTSRETKVTVGGCA